MFANPIGTGTVFQFSVHVSATSRADSLDIFVFEAVGDGGAQGDVLLWFILEPFVCAPPGIRFRIRGRFAVCSWAGRSCWVENCWARCPTYWLGLPHSGLSRKCTRRRAEVNPRPRAEMAPDHFQIPGIYMSFQPRSCSGP